MAPVSYIHTTYVAALLEHVDRDVVVVNALGRGVDAGELDAPVVAGLVVVPVLLRRAGALAAAAQEDEANKNTRNVKP